MPAKSVGFRSASEESSCKPTSTRAAAKLGRHYVPAGFSDRVAFGFVKLICFIADSFFAKRYGHRAVALETVAAVPGMVGGRLIHPKSFRRMHDDEGWIKTLLDEAENERMYLMTFVLIARPNGLERALVLLTQGIFFNCFFLLYLVSPRTAHRQEWSTCDDGLVSPVRLRPPWRLRGRERRRPSGT